MTAVETTAVETTAVETTAVETTAVEPNPVSPSRDDGGTTRPARRCAGCETTFTPTGRQRHCSTACRKRVFRARHAAEVDTTSATGTRRAHTIYQCPACGERQLGTQRCEGCGRFGSAVGLGGACPGCGEPVTLGDLDLEPQVPSKAAR